MLQSGVRTVPGCRRTLAFSLPLILAASALGQGTKRGKPEKEPPTQTLPALKDLPAAVSADTARLAFHVSPLSNKGLLLQQTRDAINALMQASHGGKILKLRAFVSGTGDARRVQSIVSETFADKKLPLPALSTIQAGGLPLEGAQVVIESVSEEKDKKPVNPNGLAFFPAQRADGAKDALAQLEAAAKNADVAPADMLRVTCFLNSDEDEQAAHAEEARAFPSAAADFVQRLRASSGSSTACEAVGRRKSDGPGQVNSEAVLVNTAKLILSGSQMAFHDQDADLRLAFQRLEKSLEPLGASYEDVIYADLYPVSRSVEDKLPALRKEFFRGPAPATTMIFEGLPSPDASVSIEVIATQKADAVRN